MNSTRVASRRQEEYVSKLLNGRCIANSGATPMQKGDARVTTALLLECKTVLAKRQHVTFDRRWLEGVRRQALAMRCEQSAVVLDFGGPPEYFVVREDFFVELFEAWQEARKEAYDGESSGEVSPADV